MATSSVTGESVPADAGHVSEQEVQTRLASVKVGLGLTLIVSLGGALYALGRSNQDWILGVIGLGLLSVPLVRALPLDRIVRGPSRDFFFAGWSIADLLLIATIAALDGGSHSAYMLLLVLPFLFASLSYPTKWTALVGVVALAAFFAVAFGVGGGFPLSGFGLFAGICVALLASWEARNQLRQRRALAEAAIALSKSESSSRLQADQQREVARFGQLALEGIDIDELSHEACRIVTQVLEIDYAGIAKLLPGGEELLLVAAAGMPDEMVGQMKIPAGYRSQSGYALATGTAIVVNDWQHETRFQQSEIQTSQGMQSAAIILIKVTGKPYGVLGTGSRVPHDFTQVEFLLV